MANMATSTDLGGNMITALDNLANTAVQKNDMVEMLVIANKALTDSLVVRNKECACLMTLSKPSSPAMAQASETVAAVRAT